MAEEFPDELTLFRGVSAGQLILWNRSVVDEPRIPELQCDSWTDRIRRKSVLIGSPANVSQQLASVRERLYALSFRSFVFDRLVVFVNSALVCNSVNTYLTQLTSAHLGLHVRHCDLACSIKSIVISCLN